MSSVLTELWYQWREEGIPLEIKIAIGAGVLFIIALITLITSLRARSKRIAQREYMQSHQRLEQLEKRLQNSAHPPVQLASVQVQEPPQAAPQMPEEVSVPAQEMPQAAEQAQAEASVSVQQVNQAELLLLTQQMQELLQKMQELLHKQSPDENRNKDS